MVGLSKCESRSQRLEWKGFELFAAAMAVPKKKTSKAKKRSRKAVWKRKAALQAQRALSLGKSVLTGRAGGFMYPSKEDEEDDEE